MSEHAQLWTRVGVAALILAVSTAAQAKEDVAARALAATAAPNAREPLSSLSAISIEGGQDGATATLKFGAERNDISWLRLGNAVGHFRTASVALSAPVDNKRGFTSSLTNDGLSDMASVSIQFSELKIPATAPVDRQTLCGEMRAGFEKLHPGQTAPGCSTELAFEVGGKALADQYNAAIDQALAERLISYFGVSAEIGRRSYEFYDPTTLAKSEANRTPWRIGAFYAWIGGRENWALTIRYAHEEAFREGQPRTVCLASSAPVLDCASGAFGHVKRIKKDILSLEGRWAPAQVDLGIAKAKVGIAPKVAYDTQADNWAVALPIYLFGDKTGLTGGVRGDWTSTDHDITVGVFITKTLSITNAL
ncbi:hypothetical protein [Caulobacter sp. BP25]|uniref:hypothetical protein n=1 Tax=Caulobacter sp. BP25 TaxID=2048900 RepID=UPI000C129ECA|nr:hypothetical protein [Caulobacter sp. BP25]PHY18803.1 hypothetical protein CSW59_10135 [Caulobacter sp. BP25]